MLPRPAAKSVCRQHKGEMPLEHLERQGFVWRAVDEWCTASTEFAKATTHVVTYRRSAIPWSAGRDEVTREMRNRTAKPLVALAVFLASAVTPEASARVSVPSLPQVAALSPPSAGLSDDTLFATGTGLTPADLVGRVLRGNQDLAAARLEIERARGRLQQAELYPNPTIEVDYSRGLGQQREDAVSVSLPAPLFGRRSTAIAAARAALALAQSAVRERERQIAAAVLGAHAELLGAARSLEVSDELIRVNEDLRRLVAARVQEQDAPALDLRLLDVEIQRLRAKRILARANMQAQEYALRVLLGLGSETLTLRSDPPLPEIPAGVASIGAVVALALEHRPDLRSARAAEQLAAAQLRRTQAEARPEIGLFGRYSSKTATSVLSGDAEQLIGGGISVSLPIFNRNQGAIAEAETAVRQASLQREALERTVRSEVAGAVVRLKAARQALAIYEHDVNAASQANLKTLREAYEIGAVPLSDLLNEQRRIIEATTDFTAASAEAYRAAADLQLATGEGLSMDDHR